MHERLRSAWDEPRPADPPTRVWRDWALAAVLVPAAVIEGVLRKDLAWPVTEVVLTVGLVPTLLWRRTRPLLMVAIAFVCCGISPLFTGGDSTGLNVLAFITLLPYALFRWGSGRAALVGTAIMFGKIGLWAAVGYLRLSDAALGFTVVFAAGALGAAVRFRAGARARELDQVKLLERERLARDLHDTVAHHVSAMAIRAQAGLATAATNPHAATEALIVIEAEASQALAEMRAMVRVLRDHQPTDPVQHPRLADLAQLPAGPAIDVEIEGDLDDLHPSLGTAIYRLTQESITNARRHARHATRIEVRVAVADTAVHLRISDDGDPHTGRPATARGYGLVGMAERAGLLGGTCEAGPDPGRGWTVTATLPRTALAT